MRRRFHFALAGANGGGGVSLPAAISADDNVASPATASASITFNDDGTYQTFSAPGTIVNWFNPDGPGVATPYEIRFAPSSGSVSSGTVNTWLAFPQTWTRTRVLNGISEVTGTLEIRLASSGVVQATTTLTLTAERT